MRDDNRLKEKIELRLDRRQVTSLSVVGLLLASGIFVLGVMVGKNLSPLSKASQSQEGLLDKLDAAAIADSGASEALTFQDELTKKLPKLPAPPSEPRAKAPVQKEPAPTAVASADAGTSRPAPVAFASAAPVDAGTKLVPQPPADIDSGVEVAIAPRVALPAPTKAFFTVQVKATQSSAEADSYARRLRSQGYQALVAEAEVPGKGRWFRVRVGKFESRPSADRYLVDFKRETHVEAFVTAAGH